MQRLPAELLFSLCYDGHMQLTLSATCRQFRQMFLNFNVSETNFALNLNVDMDPITFRYRIQQGLIFKEEQTCMEITTFIQSIEPNILFAQFSRKMHNMVRALKSLCHSYINLLLERRFLTFFMHNAIQTNYFVNSSKRLKLIK